MNNNYDYNYNYNNNNNKKNNNGMRTFLYIFFFFLIVASGVILFYVITNPTTIIYTPPETEEAPEELFVDDKEKYKIKINGEVVKMSPDVDIAQERINHNNQDIIARLEVPDMFNILVVRGSDNKLYLDHSIDARAYDYKGSSFMDYRVDTNSNQINIYGHNSRDVNIQVPLMRLEKFLEKSYFDENPYIILQFENGKRVYKIAAITEVYNDNLEHMRVNKVGADFVNHIQTILSNPINSRPTTINQNSKVIILQTCSHHLDNAVYLITGVAIDYVEE